MKTNDDSDNPLNSNGLILRGTTSVSSNNNSYRLNRTNNTASRSNPARSTSPVKNADVIPSPVRRVIENNDRVIIVDTDKEVIVNNYEEILEQKYIDNGTGNVTVGLTVDNQISSLVSNVTKLGFNSNEFSITQLGSGLASVASGSRFEKRVVMGTNNIDVALGNYYLKTITGATTLTVSNLPSLGYVACFILELTNGGSGAITWWSGVTWEEGIPPTLTASGVDVLGFYSTDVGTTWRGLLLGKDMLV
jgi:hypothetical protein